MGGFSDKRTASEAGKKGKPGKHLKTKQWEALGEFITQEGAERFADIMNTSDNDTFIDMYLKALNYFKPKINQNYNEDKSAVSIEYINVSKQFPDEK